MFLRHCFALGRSLVALSVVILASCGSSTPEPVRVAKTTQALWTNGDFESDNIGVTPPTGWTVTTYANNSGVTGSSTAAPSSFSALNLASGGKLETFVVGGAAETQTDPDLGAGQAFRFPKYGSRGVRVNYKDATDTGKNKNANGLKQTMTIALGDVDPTDGLAHVRFAVAPVLENPSHGYTQQPYYFVELLNLTRGTTLYHDFNTAGQAGVPWNTTTSVVSGNTTQWTNWQLVDLAPGPTALAVGDQVQLNVIGSGCSLGGHFGRIYVDGTGSSVPGIYTWATGPSSAPANTNITYTIYYSNGGTTAAVGAHVDMVTPPQTTFSSLSGATSCTTPTAGTAGTISCPLGALAPGARGSFTVTVTIAGTATGNVVNGNYSIAAVNSSALIGAKVTTAVITAGTRYADVRVVKTANATSTNWGQALTYTIVLHNFGPNSVSTTQLGFQDVMPPQLTNVSWTCVKNLGGNSTACSTASGTGNISTHPKLGSGGEIQYTVNATVVAGSGFGTVTNTATATVTGRPDPNLANNTSVVALTIGTPRTFTLTKAGSSVSGTVTSIPAGINCGTGCSSATATYADGTALLLTATPIPGATFTGWGGACSGSASTCNVTMSGNQSVTATFAAAPAVGAAANVYVYSGDGQSTPTSVAFGKPLAALVTDANGNPVSNVMVSFAAPMSGASAMLGTPTMTNAAGIATVTATANAISGTYNVTARVSGVTTPAAFTLINVGGPNAISYVSGGNTTDPNQAPINSAFLSPLTALVTDAAGRPVPGATVTFAVPSSGATAVLSSTTAVTNSSGYASVTATANGTTGAYQVTASVTGVSATVSFQLQNISSVPASVFVVSGSGQHGPTSTALDNALVVGVADSLGNPLPNIVVMFAVPSSGASAMLSSTTATTNGLGLASVTATSNATSGNYVVNATVSGVTAPAVFALTNDGAQLIDVQSGGVQSATVGASFASLVAIVTDSGTGLPISGVTVTFSAPTSGPTATLGATTAMTNGAGLASVGATANSVAGSYSVTASTALAGAPTSFSLTNAPGAPASIAITSGNNQHATVSTPFTNLLVVTVKDASNNVIPGVQVAFAAPGSGATAALTGSPAMTDPAGQASVSASAGTVSGGPYTVSASVIGLGSPANFSLTNDPPAGCSLDSECLSTQFCNTVTRACTPKLANGFAIPSIGGHNPLLTGACSGAVAMAVCISAVCDSDGMCGYKDGSGSCDGSTAPTVCRGGACSVSGVCMPPGGCAVPGDCNFANATPVCNSGVCAIGTCNSGYSNCDSVATNGCELQTGGADVNNCGGCGTVCSLAHATAACTSGSCTVGTCDAGYSNCDASATNGCELQTGGTDVNNCGGCGVVCALAHATAACTSGACTVATCDATYSDCDASAASGCEVLTGASDDANCGGCGTVCSSGNYCATGACVAKKANSTSCASIRECASGVCASDNQCGVPNGGSCTTASVCRGGACSTSGVCMTTGGCVVDGDCTSQQFCDTSSSQCTQKLPNGTAVPMIAGHTPPLVGLCSSSVGSAVCVAVVCDGADDECGYANGHGSCTSASATKVCRSGVCGGDGKCGYPDGEGACSNTNAATVCRSGSCSTASKLCLQASHCALDGDCSSAEFCDTSAGLCTPKLKNGTPIPSIDGHSPALTGACDKNVGTAVCKADVCDSADDKCGSQNGDGSCTAANGGDVCRSAVCGGDGKCGYPDGEGPCTTVDAGTVCRSGLCSASTHVCIAPPDCTVDSDCSSTQFCDTSSNLCVPKLANGAPVPTITGHEPALDGICSEPVGTAVCRSAVCDNSDDKCGYQNGNGPCSDGGAPVCRSGACGSDGKCGYPDGEGACTSQDASAVCRTGNCSADGVCGTTAVGCSRDTDCSSKQYCDGSTHACKPKKRDGSACAASNQCLSASCDAQARQCNSCFGKDCGRLKLAGGGVGCSAAPGQADGRGHALGALTLLLLTFTRRTRRRTRV
jgi:uncharacterized repeat protein (TIGR01451 family)